MRFCKSGRSHRIPTTRESRATDGARARVFERRFNLAEHVIVSGASLENGLLAVDLVREVPEAMKPRRIEIHTGKTIENKRAA